MTGKRLLSLLPRLVTVAVLAGSGGYLLVYLYRWEWNRALISGLFFVSAEVALATAVVLRRLAAVDQRIDRALRADPAVAARRDPLARPDPFAWLRRDVGRLGVFIPVLLGAGAILSAIAFVVERIAEATASPATDDHLARRLAAITAPAGGLLAPRPPSGGVAASAPARSAVRGALALASVVVIAAFAVQVLAEATQSAPESGDRPRQTVITMEVAQHRSHAPAIEVAEALWIACRSTVSDTDPPARLESLGGDRVAVVLRPGIGDLGERRLTGCLSDATLNLTRARVLDVETVD